MTLRMLNMESNYIRGEAICDLLEAINIKQSVTEIHVANQVGQIVFKSPFQDMLRKSYLRINLVHEICDHNMSNEF